MNSIDAQTFYDGVSVVGDIPYILCPPPWPLREIRIAVCDDVWTPSAVYDALVDTAWAKMRMDQPLWDSLFYRVLDLSELSGGAKVRLGVVAYRYIATYRALRKQHKGYGLKPLYHLSTAALVRTSDGFFVFGMRAQNGMPDLLGGGVQPEELAVTCGADLEENLYKELMEEAGIHRSDVEELAGMGVVIAENSNVIVMALVHLKIGSGKLQTQFSSRTENEMAELVFVPEIELHKYLGQMTDYRRLISNLFQKVQTAR